MNAWRLRRGQVSFLGLVRMPVDGDHETGGSQNTATSPDRYFRLSVTGRYKAPGRLAGPHGATFAPITMARRAATTRQYRNVDTTTRLGRLTRATRGPVLGPAHRKSVHHARQRLVQAKLSASADICLNDLARMTRIVSSVVRTPSFLVLPVKKQFSHSACGVPSTERPVSGCLPDIPLLLQIADAGRCPFAGEGFHNSTEPRPTRRIPPPRECHFRGRTGRPATQPVNS